MSHKEAALMCGVDFSEWSRAIHGLGRFDAAWLLRLPWRFIVGFSEDLLREAWRVHVLGKETDAEFWKEQGA